MPASWDVGDSVPLTWELFESDGETPADATVSLTVIAPDGTTSSPAVTHVGTGVYSASVTPSMAGMYRFRWTATGALTAAEESAFTVRRQGSNAVAVQDVKSRLRKVSDSDDDKIQAMIDAALAEYELYVGPLPGSVTEYFDGGGTAIVLSSPHASAVTAAVYDDDTTITASDLTVRNGIVRWGYGTAGRFTYGVQNVAITYTVGTLPDSHREAIIADVAGYFAATQRSGEPRTTGDGYADGFYSAPTTLFPRIRALAPPAIA